MVLGHLSSLSFLGAYACTHSLNIATIAERLPDWFRAERPEIAWPALKGMRNLIAHVYDGVDDEFVWRALKNRVPAMVAELAPDSGL